MRISRRNGPSATHSTASPASKDPPFTVGAPITPDDLLPAVTLPGWTLACRAQMSFDGPGGVGTLEHAEVVRASQAVSGDSANERASKVPFL